MSLNGVYLYQSANALANFQEIQSISCQLLWKVWWCQKYCHKLRVSLILHQARLIWAASWQNQRNDCEPSEDSDQPGHPPSLIRVFAVRMKKTWVLSYPLSAQRRLWSDWADAQADLSLHWAHSHFAGFVLRQLILFTSSKSKWA